MGCGPEDSDFLHRQSTASSVYLTVPSCNITTLPHCAIMQYYYSTPPCHHAILLLYPTVPSCNITTLPHCAVMQYYYCLISLSHHAIMHNIPLRTISHSTDLNLIPLNAPFSFICDFSSLTALSSSSVGGVVEPLLVGSPWVLARERLYWGGAGRNSVELGYMGWGYTSLVPRPPYERRGSGDVRLIPQASLTLITFWGEFSLHCRKHNCSATPKSLAQLQQAMNFFYKTRGIS